MGLGHVNRRELDEIILISKKNPSQAISMFEEYLKKYPKSYSTYTLYAGTLIVLKRFDEAEKVLNNLDTIFEKDKNLIKGTKDYVLLQRDITFVKLKLLAYQKKFEELYDYYNEHCNELGSEYNLDFIKLFCLKKMGKAINVSKFKRKSYLNGQIAEYSEKDFLGHIKGHFSEYNDLEHDHYASVFSGEFPVYKVIDEIKKYIPSNKGLCLGFFEDTYIFKFDNCGVEGGKRTDYFKVVCFSDTQDIITMYPAQRCEELPCIDLNYMNQHVKQVKKTVNFSCGDIVELDGEKYIVRKIFNRNEASLIKIVSRKDREVSFYYDKKYYTVLKNSVVANVEDLTLIERCGSSIVTEFEKAKKGGLNSSLLALKRLGHRVGCVLLIDDCEHLIIDIYGGYLIVVDENKNMTCLPKKNYYEIIYNCENQKVDEVKSSVGYNTEKRNELIQTKRKVQ